MVKYFYTEDGQKSSGHLKELFFRLIIGNGKEIFMMSDKKDNIFIYGLIGAGYLLFCSALPSILAMNYAPLWGFEINAIYAPLSFVTGVVYMILIFALMGEKMEIFARFSLKGLGEAMITAFILFVVINFAVSPLLSILFPASAGNYDNNMTDMMSTPVATFFQVAFIAPLFEELIFRGLILKRALRKWNSAAGVIMTAALFGILHMSVVQGLSAAAAGLLLSMFYVRRKSVGLNILAHGIYNGMVFGLALLIY